MSDHVPGQISNDGAVKPTTGDTSRDFGEEGSTPGVDQYPGFGDDERSDPESQWAAVGGEGAATEQVHDEADPLSPAQEDDDGV
jgi:hypothetical protein